MAMAMLAMIVGIMGGALSAAYQTSEKGEKKIEALERKKGMLSFLESQIQSAFESHYTEEGETKSRFTGKGDVVTFASRYSIWRGTSGHCLVTYHVETDDRQKSVLRIEEQVLGTDIEQETSVKTDHDSIRFQYFFKDVLEEGEWVDEWPADGPGMPSRLRVIFTDRGKERVLTARVFAHTVSAAVGVTSKPVVSK